MKINQPIGAEIMFTGGRENSPTVKVVESNYHAADKGERLLQIDSPVSLETLEDIIRWAQKG